jgi:hypothetical protein
LEEYVTSIIRVGRISQAKKQREADSKQSGHLLGTWFKLVSRLAYPSTLKLAATYSSEMLVDFQCTTWHYIPLYIVNIVALNSN